MNENIQTLEAEMVNFCCASGKDPKEGIVRATARFPDRYTPGWDGMPVPDAPFDILTKNLDRTFFAVNGYGTGFEDREWYFDENLMFSHLVPEVKEQCGPRPFGWGKKKKDWRECRDKVEAAQGGLADLEQQVKEQIVKGDTGPAQGGIKVGTIIGIGLGAVALLALGTYLLIRAKRR